MHRFVRISDNVCFAIFHSVVAEKHLFTKRMKNEIAPLYVCTYRDEARYVRSVCHGNIAFYMPFYRPKLITRLFRHSDQDRITIARAVISASPEKPDTCEANETPLSRRIAKIQYEKRTLSLRELYKCSCLAGVSALPF